MCVYICSTHMYTYMNICVYIYICLCIYLCIYTKNVTTSHLEFGGERIAQHFFEH